MKIRIPKKPTQFYFEEAKLFMTEKNIKDFQELNECMTINKLGSVQKMSQDHQILFSA